MCDKCKYDPVFAFVKLKDKGIIDLIFTNPSLVKTCLFRTGLTSSRFECNPVCFYMHQYLSYCSHHLNFVFIIIIIFNYCYYDHLLPQ